MRVVIAGGHGKIALITEGLLSRRGDSVAGFIRNPAHTGDVEQAGAGAVVLDLEQASVEEVASQLTGADAVVFAAGAGPGSGAARKETVDRDAAILLADAAQAAGVRRYVMISSMARTPRHPTRQAIPSLLPICAPKGRPTTPSVPAPRSTGRSCGRECSPTIRAAAR